MICPKCKKTQPDHVRALVNGVCQICFQNEYMSEHDLQNLIRLKLTKLGWLTFRMNVGKFKLTDGRWFDTGLPAGFSDLIALKDGKTIFIEVKAENGKASKAQLNFIEQMKKNGFIAGIVYSLDDALNLINSN